MVATLTSLSVPIVVLCREALRAGNAATVLATLVPQARAIFGILAAAQIAATSEAGEEPGQHDGLSFQRMHWQHPLLPASSPGWAAGSTRAAAWLRCHQVGASAASDCRSGLSLGLRTAAPRLGRVLEAALLQHTSGRDRQVTAVEDCGDEHATTGMLVTDELIPGI